MNFHYPPDLPVCARREEILKALRRSQVLVVAGETGSGKTTQLPKMCLEAGLDKRGMIGCTQPRRVAAMSVSRRVAEELRVPWGRDVGCKMRFADDTSRDTRIKFMTDGILLAEVQSDPMLQAYSALIIDEAHERSLNIDFLLGYLQGLLRRRADLKLVITSATIDTHAFAAAFGNAPIIEVSGRLYPVDIVYRPIGGEREPEVEDELDKAARERDAEPELPEQKQSDTPNVSDIARDLASLGTLRVSPSRNSSATPAPAPMRQKGPAPAFREVGDDISIVEAAARATEDTLIETDDGDILVFLPTERDIREAKDLLEGSLGTGIEVLGLFGRMPAAEQQRIFSPSSRRRVVLATNIAETSITLPRIVTVIDTGLARISRYNPRTRTKRLPVETISQSSANQRAGRAGRVQAGTCIRLYDEDDFARRPPFSQPEIQRANLAEVILRMKAHKLGQIEDFPFIDAPRPQSIRSGYQLLHELGALDDTHELTPMGRELAKLPLDPSLGRMLLQARKEGALPEMLIIAAGLSIPDPRERPETEREQAATAHKSFQDMESDFMSLLKIWRAAPDDRGVSRNALRKFCKSNFLSLTRMREWRDLHKQLSESMEGLTEKPPAAEKAPKAEGNAPAFNLYNALHRSILSGLLGQIAQKKERNDYQASGNRVATIFPGSNLYERKDRPRRGRQQEEAATMAPGKAGAPAATTSPGPAQSAWIMAAEIVQTSQLFARTVARIDPAWVVDLGAHLCKFSYTDQHWSARSGRVLVTERVLIYGMEVHKHQVDYGRINSREATELFIRGALIDDPSSRSDPTARYAPGERNAELSAVGSARSMRSPGAGAAPQRIQHRFFTENRKLREEIDNVLTRVRSSRMHDVDEALYQFYAARIEGVSSIHDLNALVRSRVQDEPMFLCATEEDLLGTDEPIYDRQQFPDEVALGHTVLPVRYSYTPGNEEDGVTLRVPLPVAEKMSTGQIQWMVPGLREEQISVLMRALPKAKRVALMPIEVKVPEVAARFQPGAGDFLRELATYLTRTYRVAIDASDWNADSLPQHLRPRVEVVDQRNKTVASGRDIDAVRARVAKIEVKSSAWDRAVSKWERYAITTWSFGDLPENIVVEHIAGAPLLAWPGLSARSPETETPASSTELEVDLRLFRTKDEAERESRRGIRRLAEIVLARDIAWLNKTLETWAKQQIAGGGTNPVPGQRQTSGLQGLQGLSALNTTQLSKSGGSQVVGTASKGGGGSAVLVRRAALEHICTSALVLIPVYPLTAQRFEAMLATAKQTFPTWASSVAAITRQILGQRDTILAFPKRYAGLEADVERLAGIDFLARTPHAQLPHLQRYLKAVQVRAERASLNPTKDAEKAKPLEPFAGKEREVPEVRRQAFRWMLEEFRVSLFAPELGTAYPVSPQRLKALKDGA